jgi:gamma-glutamyltranspeptidase/glutathione hydrolase
MQTYLKVFFAAICCVVIVPSAGAQSGRTPAPARHGMVVTNHYVASEIGRDILARGGNAIDAAVATAFALAVVLPSAGNIGGGGFIVYHGADGFVTSFNFREKAPMAATARMYLDENGDVRDNSNHDGILAVGVPGTVAGLALAHERLGTMKWADLVKPAVRLADKGFSVSWNMERFLKQVIERADDYQYASTARVFSKDGRPYVPGDVLRQKDLARTLKRIQKKGKDGFYAGKTAQLIASYMREHGGLITEEDLARYEAVEQPPTHGTYRGYDVYSMAPPSSGGVVLTEMLNILEGYDVASLGHNSALYLHVLTETMRRAYADRARYLGDPTFNPKLPMDKLVSKEYAEQLRSSIDMSQASVSDSANFNIAFESPETTHISIVDGQGNAVALTYTLEYGYGSKIVVDGAGFLLNNEMGDFNPIPGLTTSTGLIGTDPNLVAPEKRMLSSMTPTIVARGGQPTLLIGSPGGRTIINTVLQVILNVIDHGMNVAQAVEAGRIHHQWLPDTTRFETWQISQDTRRMYEDMGHRVRLRSSQGSANGILVDRKSGLLYGAADSRGFDSRSAGY